MIMNREIKFRGLNKKNNQWLYGYFFKYPDGRTVIYESDSSCWEVLSSSVGQYTGLKDKNGTEIYDGDILIDEDFGYPLKMVWFDGCFKLYGKGSHLPDVIPAYESLQRWELRIIGNIHDNPELFTSE